MTDENSAAFAGNRTPSGWLFKVAVIAGAVAIAALAVLPFFVGIAPTASGRRPTLRLLSTHDLNEHLVVMEQFDQSIRSGALYPRWIADINDGYGNAWTNFYPPASYYLTSVLHAAAGDWVLTVGVLCVIAMAGSGLAFYILSRLFYGKAASVIAASLYVLLPYHVLDLYMRGALAELLGFVFLPLLIYFAFRLGNGGRLIHYGALGLTYGLYVMTHLPVAYLMSYVLLVYAAIWALRKRNRSILLRIGGGMALGLILCAIYLLPASLEAKYVYESTSGMFQYNSGYVPALPPHDIFGDTLNHSFMLQAIALAIAYIALQGPWPVQGANESPSRSAARDWVVLGVLATLMVTPLSFYLSKLVPRTDLVAFPWRWLAIAGLFTSLMIAAAIDRLSGDGFARIRRLVFCVGILLVVGLNVWFTAYRVIVGTIANTSAAFAPRLVEANYTPKGATPPQDLQDTPKVVVEPAGGAVEILRWDPQVREVHVNASEMSRVRLKTYNFPGWVAQVDGKPSPVLSDTDGIQIVEVPAGRHKIEASFVNTPPRTAGAFLSALGLLVVIGLAALDPVREARRVTEQPTSRRAAILKSLMPLVAITVTVVIGAVILLWLGGQGRSSGVQISGGEAPAKTGGSITQGAEATLHIDGVTSILLAVDEQTLNQLMNALPAKDNPKIEAMVQSGKLLRVDNDTRVRILETGTGKTKVRILEGAQLMADGWAPERWLR